MLSTRSQSNERHAPSPAVRAMVKSRQRMIEGFFTAVPVPLISLVSRGLKQRLRTLPSAFTKRTLIMLLPALKMKLLILSVLVIRGAIAGKGLRRKEAPEGAVSSP